MPWSQAGPHDAATHVREWRVANEQLLLDRFSELLSIPNVASDTVNIRRNAEHIMGMLEQAGMRTELLELDDEAFLAELQEEFGYRLGKFSRVGKRAAYPLILSKALRLTATRSILVGNSAHGLHPVSAQGFNLGMRDVAALCDCIADAPADTADPGDPQLLDRYADWRKADQKKLVHFTDKLVRLFASTRPGLRTLRNIGMIGFDLIPGVRPMFAKHTMGLAGELPRLSRGVPIR